MSNKVTLTGHFTLLDGTPAVGNVLIRPSRSPLLDLDGNTVIAGPQRFQLDEEGRFSADLPPTDDPTLGENFTYHVMVSMHHTNWQVIGLTLPVGMISVDVLDPPAGVVKEYPTRAEWDALTGAAVAEMEAALDGAETARDVSVEARDVTVVARDETLAARDTAVGARDTAVGAAGEAETARTETFTARDATFTARDTTIEARDATFTARTETITTAGEAESARDTAVGAAGDAETARDEAVGAAGEAEEARQSAWEAVDTPGRQGPPGEVTTAALTTALAGKVTGQGMTVRHDTTVGTRVLLDHPGGSTMLYGDTGWRDISGELLNGWTGSLIFIRRQNNTVELFVPHSGTDPLTGADATNKIFLPWFTGFRASTRTNYGALGFFNSTTGPVAVSREATRGISMPLGSDRLTGSITWTTDQPWPDTLPGLPG